MSLYHDPLSCAPAHFSASPVFFLMRIVSLISSIIPGLTSTLRITSSDIIINSIKLTSCAVYLNLHHQSKPVNMI
nr:MAG TPA: hypothetical protein [Caudoviricetes sp.]